MPLAKLMRRIRLDLRRRVSDELVFLRKPVAMAPVGRRDRRPNPLFGPRLLLAPRRDGENFCFTFLGRSVAMTGSAIDWTASELGPEHQLWRMNLHYMEFLEGVDDAAWAHLVTDWINVNRSHVRRSWRDSWSSYALSIRVVVWMQELARRGDRLPSDVAALVEASTAAQLRFLERNLETDLGGNHLIKNIKALIWASAYFIGAEARRWGELGLRLLDAELGKQVLGDGVHEERSASYHGQVLADLLECRHALGQDPLQGKLDAALEGMAQAVADLAHPDGGPVLFNDAGLNMAYSPEQCLAVVEGLLGRRPEPRRMFVFPAAGYYGARGEDTYLIADCGRIAPDDLPAHAHGDVLAFEWSVGGHRMIVDQGVYEYIAGPRRQQARAAASHNTLCFEGADQAEFYGAFRCGRRPRPKVLRYQARPDGFLLEGTHDGYRHLPGRPRHTRRFEVSEHHVRIVDRLEGEPRSRARIAFLLHPEVRAAASGRVAHLERGGVDVALHATQPVEIEPAVWWPDMGRELATHRLVLTLPRGVTCAETELSVLRVPART